MELQEIGQCADQQHGHAIRDEHEDARKDIPKVQRALAPCQRTQPTVELWDRGGYNNEQATVNIEQELYEKLPVVKADAIVDPRAMMVHVKYAAIADTAMVSAIWLPNIAHLAISPPLCFITHVEAPIRWHNTWVCHDALIEGRKQVYEQDVVEEENDDGINTPQFGAPNQAEKRKVYAKYNT